jgi:hypothetical protein
MPRPCRSLLHGGEEVVAAARGRPRELAVLGSGWFAAGMHDSPFCVWGSGGPDFVDDGRQELAGMRFRNSARPPAEAASEPRTVVGRWLLAGLLNQVEERDRLRPMLNGGESGWNYDEPGMRQLQAGRRRPGTFRGFVPEVTEYEGACPAGWWELFGMDP